MGDGKCYSEEEGELFSPPVLLFFPTIFPLLTKKIELIELTAITAFLNNLYNLLKSLVPNYLFVISGLAVQVRPWAPWKSRGCQNWLTSFLFPCETLCENFLKLPQRSSSPPTQLLQSNFYSDSKGQYNNNQNNEDQCGYEIGSFPPYLVSLFTIS